MKDCFVVPGQDVSSLVQQSLTEEGQKYIVGPGLIREQQTTKALKAGRLKMKAKPTVFWVESRQRRVSLALLLSFP